MDCHFLLQGIFLTQSLNLYLLHLLVGGFFTTEPSEEPRTTHTLSLLSHPIMDYVKSFTEIYFNFKESLQLELIIEFHLNFSM